MSFYAPPSHQMSNLDPSMGSLPKSEAQLCQTVPPDHIREPNILFCITDKLDKLALGIQILQGIICAFGCSFSEVLSLNKPWMLVLECLGIWKFPIWISKWPFDPSSKRIHRDHFFGPGNPGWLFKKFSKAFILFNRDLAAQKMFLSLGSHYLSQCHTDGGNFSSVDQLTTVKLYQRKQNYTNYVEAQRYNQEAVQAGYVQFSRSSSSHFWCSLQFTSFISSQ
jgi:hypothetical protein